MKRWLISPNYDPLWQEKLDGRNLLRENRSSGPNAPFTPEVIRECTACRDHLLRFDLFRHALLYGLPFLCRAQAGLLRKQFAAVNIGVPSHKCFNGRGDNRYGAACQYQSRETRRVQTNLFWHVDAAVFPTGALARSKSPP
jgi:hypothetical protein